MNKVEKRLTQSQGNVWPSMLEDHATHLGVTSDSLAALGLGWAPVIQFKKSKSTSGWWLNPERDPAGRVVGLSLRSQGGLKVMYPGSKHGLIYPLNPHHQIGQEAYHAGAHNWVRTMDAGVPCPVCNKPDGCLLSSEDPEDPQAVICIRVKTGSVSKQKFGFRHHLKPEADVVAGAPVLMPSDKPVIIVEGLTDTAAAMDMGFVAVGRPSNLACMQDLADLVRGREVIIIGENDEINPITGQNPGHEGMIAAMQMVKKTCKNTRAVLPPSHFKDLRQWKTAASLNADQFLDHVERYAQEEAEGLLVLPDAKPKTAAVCFLDDTHRMAGRYLLKHWRDTWYTYDRGRYISLTPAELEQPVYDWADNKQVMSVSNKGDVTTRPLVCDNNFLNNLTRAMRASTLVKGDINPCWINESTGPDPMDLIVLTNGILHIPAYLDGAPENKYLLESTPDLFTTTAMPFAFDPTATCHLWKRFLLNTIGYELANIDLLQEWFGYCLTADTSLQKMMYMRGPSGAGKGVTCNILAKLCGSDQDQVASTDFANLTGTFGAQPLVDKTLAIIPDARNTRNSDAMRALELLLNIAAGDPIQIRRMYKESIARLKLGCRIVVASNEFIDVPDNQGAMARRLLLLEFKKSFVNKEDWNLENKLAKELPGIAVWALEGLRRLRKNKGFTIPEASREALKEWRTATSPMASFLAECVDEDPKGEVNRDKLYDAWSQWSRERHIKTKSKSRFYEMIRSNAPQSSTRSYTEGNQKHTVFLNLSLKPWAERQYLGKV